MGNSRNAQVFFFPETSAPQAAAPLALIGVYVCLLPIISDGS